MAHSRLALLLTACCLAAGAAANGEPCFRGVPRLPLRSPGYLAEAVQGR